MPNRRERQLQLSHEMDTLTREEARERAAASQPSESSQLEQPETLLSELNWRAMI